MITAVDRFVLSKSPYAIQVGSFHVEDCTRHYQGVTRRSFEYVVTALWVRRTRGVLGVHIGRLSESFDTPDLTFEQFCDQHSLARYGANVHARWDGNSLWTPSPIPRREENVLLTTLEPAFEHLVPLINAKAPVTAPDGWTGWYELSDRRRA